MSAKRRYPQHQFARSPGSCELILVRHGESAVADLESPFALQDGHADPPLHSKGVAQANALAVRLAGDRGKIHALYVSSLIRTQQTAEPISASLGLTPIVEPDLREVFMGVLEGGEYRRAEAEGDEVLRRAYSEGTRDVIPGAEREATFTRRVHSILTRLTETHPDEQVLAVTHGGFIDKAFSIASGSAPLGMVPDNASITRIVITGDRWQARGFNDLSHL